MNFGTGVLTAVIMLIAPGAIVGRAAGVRWPLAVAVAPALTYGVVALAIVPFGALGIRWNAWSAAATLAGVDGPEPGTPSQPFILAVFFNNCCVYLTFS